MPCCRFLKSRVVAGLVLGFAVTSTILAIAALGVSNWAASAGPHRPHGHPEDMMSTSASASPSPSAGAALGFPTPSPPPRFHMGVFFLCQAPPLMGGNNSDASVPGLPMVANTTGSHPEQPTELCVLLDRTAVCSGMFEHHSRPAPEGAPSSEDPEDPEAHHHPKPCREYRQIAASQGLAILHVILIGLTVGVMAATLMTSTGAGVHPRVKVTVVALATLSAAAGLVSMALFADFVHKFEDHRRRAAPDAGHPMDMDPASESGKPPGHAVHLHAGFVLLVVAWVAAGAAAVGALCLNRQRGAGAGAGAGLGPQGAQPTAPAYTGMYGQEEAGSVTLVPMVAHEMTGVSGV